jgi:cytochrome oxidase Cu insertion factor (SCO1/SenC/PrrC family)
VRSRMLCRVHRSTLALEKEREAKQVGRAHVGGPFALSTYQDRPFTEQDLVGKWNFVYFGFTNCPDICPAELDKMGVIVDALGRFILFYFCLLDMNGLDYRKRTRCHLPTCVHLC